MKDARSLASSRSSRWPAAVLAATVLGLFAPALSAAGGPLGIDQRLAKSDTGAFSRDNQLAVRALLVGGVVAGALWEGGETRLGRTLWRAIDSGAIAAGSVEIAKRTFTRARPAQTDDPDRWLEGRGHYSFPSGEVALASAIVTPFILEYAGDVPATYALALVPTYVAVGRVKSQGHWQTDVLASLAIGALTGWYAASRERPIFLSILPDGVRIGVRYRW